MSGRFQYCPVCKKLNLQGQRCPNEGTPKHDVHSMKPRKKSRRGVKK